MPVLQALNGSNVPVTGLSPTWLYYGTPGGAAYGADRRPLWVELGQGSYCFNPYTADKQNGVVWVVDLGASVSRRYRWGTLGGSYGYKAFLRIAGGVPAGTTPPTVNSYWLDGSAASPVPTVLNRSSALAGLFLIQEPMVNQRPIWTDKGAVSMVDFGVTADTMYRYQSEDWGSGIVETIDMTQFNILEEWPDTLPADPFAEGDATYTPVPNVIVTESDTGPFQRRRRFTGRQEYLEFSAKLSPEQMATLETFYRVTLAEVRKFTWFDFRTMEEANYRFDGKYTASYWASDTPDDQGRHAYWHVHIRLELVD